MLEKDIIIGRNQTLDSVKIMINELKMLPDNYEPFPDAKKLSAGNVIARRDYDKIIDLAPRQSEIYTGKVNTPKDAEVEMINENSKILSFRYRGIKFNLWDSSEVAIGRGF